MNVVPVEALGWASRQLVSRPLADPSFSPCPLCVFQSAEFFEMLEKMQVSIPKVGKLSPGWGVPRWSWGVNHQVEPMGRIREP